MVLLLGNAISLDLNRGDMNGDGSLNTQDISPFELSLAGRSTYNNSFPEIDPDVAGDINLDGVLNNFDITPFRERLGLHSPEPATMTLCVLASINLLRRPKGRQTPTPA